MVKKVDSTRSPSLTGSKPVEPGKAVGPAKVGQVAPAQAQTPARAVRRPTRPMTAAEREHLFSLVKEEAERLFGEDGLPKEKRETVETAVKMALDAAIPEEEK